jgi:hypothetical protein
MPLHHFNAGHFYFLISDTNHEIATPDSIMRRLQFKRSKTPSSVHQKSAFPKAKLHLIPYLERPNLSTETLC